MLSLLDEVGQNKLFSFLFEADLHPKSNAPSTPPRLEFASHLPSIMSIPSSSSSKSSLLLPPSLLLLLSLLLSLPILLRDDLSILFNFLGNRLNSMPLSTMTDIKLFSVFAHPEDPSSLVSANFASHALITIAGRFAPSNPHPHKRHDRHQ